MNPLLAGMFALLFQVYLGIGLLFAIAFVIWGIHRVDEDAEGTSWVFRLLMVPGSMAFWPFLLRKWMLNKGSAKQ